jgi:hypothetical protein
MPTCPPNLRHSFLTVCKIIRFKVKEKVFSTVPVRHSSVSGAKKTIFGRRYGLLDFTILFLVELGTCVQNLTSTRGVEHWEKNYFPPGGMLKFIYKGHFLTIKITYEKFLDWKSKRWKHALMPLLHVEIFIFEKH